MELQNKIAVVTGISKGIGEAVALQLLEQGCIVYGLGRNTSPNLTHANFHFLNCDIRNAKQVTDAFQLIVEHHKTIHVLINNAGLGYFGLIENMPQEEWHEMFDTNIHGMFYCCQQVIALMKQQGIGHIINIASTAALEGMPQVAGYCATKWAVKGFSESLFRELRDFGIKVTCVYPGSTKTDFFRNSPGIQPHDYMLMPQDVAKTMVQALNMPDNFHTVNLEIRPLQPKGPKK